MYEIIQNSQRNVSSIKDEFIVEKETKEEVLGIINSQDKHKEQQCFKKLLATKVKKIRKALEKILGKPKRITGSHYIFHSPYTNKNCAFSNHGTQKSENISRKSMKSYLKTYGLTAQQIVEML